MLLLVTILLVVVGTISLVFGYVQSSLVPIYISIGCSVVAFAVLVLFSRMTQKSQKVVTESGPTPFSFGSQAGAERTEQVPAMAGAGLSSRSSSGDDFAPDEGYQPSPGFGGELEAGDEDDEADVADDDFPIERYDSRRVGEILPLLAELDVDELDEVREHEERGKARPTVLARIDQLIEQQEADDREEAEHRFDAPATAPDEGDEDDEADELASSAPPSTVPVSVAALPDDDDYFPIEDYDDLRASEILPLLPELDDDELDMVRQRERSGSARASILQRLDSLRPVPEPQPEPEPEPVVAAVVVPARKARATKAPSGRRPTAGAATKAAAPRVTPAKAPVAKVPAKARKDSTVKAATVRVAKAPVKAKVPVKATVVTRAPVKKAPAAKRSGATSVKAVKAAAGKAAPVKRTTQKRAGVTSAVPAAKTTRKASKG